MAIYKDSNYFVQNANPVFDKLHDPGEQTPHSGIYRCEGCAMNAVSTHGHPLPPQNHHQHTADQGRIRWRLIAATH